MTRALSSTPHPEILLVPEGTHQIACDGQPFTAAAVPGGGHPRVYYTFDGQESVVCGYCDRLFTKKPMPGAVSYVAR